MSVIIVFSIFAFAILTTFIELKAHNVNHTIFFIFDTKESLKMLVVISLLTIVSTILFWVGVSSIADSWWLILLALVLTVPIYTFIIGKPNVQKLGKLYGVLATVCFFVIMLAVGSIILLAFMLIAGALSKRK